MISSKALSITFSNYTTAPSAKPEPSKRPHPSASYYPSQTRNTFHRQRYKKAWTIQGDKNSSHSQASKKKPHYSSSESGRHHIDHTTTISHNHQQLVHMRFSLYKIFCRLLMTMQTKI
jgi:hypothetical protein